MQRIFRRRFVAIAVGSVSSAVVGAVVVIGPFPTGTRILGGCLLMGTLAAVGFWLARLRAFPVAGRFTRWWLAGCYAVGVGGLLLGVGIALWSLVVGGGSVLHWMCVLLLVIELGEHFGIRWVDGHGQWFSKRWLGGAVRVGLFRRTRPYT